MNNKINLKNNKENGIWKKINQLNKRKKRERGEEKSNNNKKKRKSNKKKKVGWKKIKQRKSLKHRKSLKYRKSLRQRKSLYPLPLKKKKILKIKLSSLQKKKESYGEYNLLPILNIIY